MQARDIKPFVGDRIRLTLLAAGAMAVALVAALILAMPGSVPGPESRTAVAPAPAAVYPIDLAEQYPDAWRRSVVAPVYEIDLAEQYPEIWRVQRSMGQPVYEIDRAERAPELFSR
jgi:hypothetical protein